MVSAWTTPGTRIAVYLFIEYLESVEKKNARVVVVTIEQVVLPNSDVDEVSRGYRVLDGR